MLPHCFPWQQMVRNRRHPRKCITSRLIRWNRLTKQSYRLRRKASSSFARWVATGAPGACVLPNSSQPTAPSTTINSVIEQNFVYIHANYHPRKAGEVGKALMKRLNNAGRFGFPVLVVLDEKGQIIHIQDSGLLEEDKSYNQKKVLSFFQNWTPKAVRGE